MKVRDPQGHHRALVAALDQAIDGLTAARKIAALLAAPVPGERRRAASARRTTARVVAPALIENDDPFAQAVREGVRIQPRPTEEISATVREAAEVLGVGEEQIRRLLRSGGLLGIPYGGRRGWRIPRAHLQEVAAERRRAGKHEFPPA
jgi:excisionase family DNA binding protein